MLQMLHSHDVDWILSGSTVLALYGALVEPNDLDVVPLSEATNLQRLTDVLTEVNAVPAHFPGWPHGLTLDQCQAWTPLPTMSNLDHLFVTRLGMLDITTITGSYEHLSTGVTRFHLFGVPVLVSCPEQVLDRLPQQTRTKDQQRAETYAKLRHRLGTDRHAYGLDRFQ